MNALNRQRIADLSTAIQAQKKENDVLEHTSNELKRMRQLDAGKHKIEIRHLENVSNYLRNQYRDIRNLAAIKDRTINELSAALRLKALKGRNEKREMEQTRAENAALIGRIALFNQCVDAMNLSSEFEKMSKQCLARNLCRQ